MIRLAVLSAALCVCTLAGWLAFPTPPPATAEVLTGSPRADLLRGTKTSDVIRGRGGNDRASGRAGNDRISGGAGKDRLSGGADEDRLSGGPGNDRLSGGPGTDVLSCGPGRDRATAGVADKVRSNCETVNGRRPGDQGDEGDDQPPPPPPLQGNFTGNLTTTVRYLSVCGGGVVGEQTTQIPSRITVGPPLQPNPADLPASNPEVNPINLILGQTNVAGTIAPGSVNVTSAARFRFSPIRSLILQYWNLALNGTALTGTLVEDQREQGAAFNLLAAHVELLACSPQFGTFVNQLAIAEGTTLTGTVTAQAIQLRITGNTIDTFHPFVAEITATRSG